ncbi:GNAT family N-acetyltransferase [Rhodovibrionaceae bacterium A322]
MPHIETERLRLRAHIESDRARYLEALNDWSVVQWFYGIPFPHGDGDFEARALELAENHLSPAPSMFAVARKNDDTLIGCITLEQAEVSADLVKSEAGFDSHQAPQTEMRLGYWFHPQDWGQGYAREAAAALLDHASDSLKLDRVFATVDPDNPVSIKLLIGLGFEEAGWEQPKQSRRGTVSMQRFHLSLTP